jgi:hypothetical protein
MQRAVSLKWLVEVFLPEHPEVEREDKSTNEVMLEIVRRETQADRCRYTDLLLRRDETKGAVSQVSWRTGAAREGGGTSLGKDLLLEQNACQRAPPLLTVSPLLCNHQGRAFFFLSHTWGRPFSELVGMVRTHFSPEHQRVWRRGQKPLELSEVRAAA